MDEIFEEEQKLRESKVNLDDLKSGIQSLIQGSTSVIGDEETRIGRTGGKPPSMPPLPREAPRPLYEILPEVKVLQSSASAEIYAPGHSYAMPSVNIAKPTEPEVKITKPVDISKQTTESEKEDQKKKQEKKDKYKVKF